MAAKRSALWRRVRRGRTPALLVAIGGVVSALGIVAFEAETFRRLEFDTVDARFSIRGERPAPDDIITVLVDDRTTNAFPKTRWPYPRRMHAKVIRRIAQDGPKAIAVDIQFTEQTTVRDDNALVSAVADAGRTVLSTTETDGKGNTRIFGGNKVLEQIGARPGSTNYVTDPGGVFRRVSWDVQGLQTFGLVAAEIASGKKIPRSALGGKTAWIDFSGGPDAIDSVSYVQVLEDEVPAGTFKDKVVVIGASVPSLQDVHATSTTGDELMPGPEIQATVVQTALAGFPLQEADDAWAIVAILVLAMLTPLACLRLSPLRAAALALAAGALYAVLVQLLFNSDTILAFTYPTAALVLASALALAAQGSATAVERARVRDVFARFVPEAVVDDVLKRTDDDLRLGGVRLEGTVMFTDLRGFTAYAEKRPPDEVIDFLNRFLAEMTDAIMGHRGTLVAFMGDGIMAVFGAPIPMDDHADRALAAAREMVGERLARVNSWLEEEGAVERFRMGVGLNSGPVLSGNVGSSQRLEYTAIGDTTNTASRIESMTKDTPYQLLLAASTYELVSVRDGLEEAGDHAVRGRENTISLYGLR